jgi:toxin ParE1/3/4
MNLVWTRSALGDLEETRGYVAEDDPAAAARLAGRILAVADRLVNAPALGRHGRVAGTREMAVPGTPYLLVYRLFADQIQVLRVLHGRRASPEE